MGYAACVQAGGEVGRSGVALEAVWRLGATFPGVHRSTAWGSPALKVKGPGGRLQLMACVPTHRSAEPGSLMIRVDHAQRAAMLEEAPELYYAPEHYLGYDAVLVRLARLRADMLPDLLALAYGHVRRKRAGGARGQR